MLLYLMVLELQEKWQEAVELLEGPLGGKQAFLLIGW